MNGMNPAPMAISNTQRLGLQAVSESSLCVPGAPFVHGGSQGCSAGMARTDCGNKHSVVLRATMPVVKLCLLSHRSFQSTLLLKKQSSGEPTPAGSFHWLSRQQGKNQN